MGNSSESKRSPTAKRCAPAISISRLLVGRQMRGAEGREGRGRGNGRCERGGWRGVVFFFTRGIAGISHKSREKPRAFEPPSFTVSTVPYLPLSIRAPAPALPHSPVVAFAHLSMALRLTTNFSSGPTFCIPARSLKYHFSSHAGDASAACAEPRPDCNYRR